MFKLKEITQKDWKLVHLWSGVCWLKWVSPGPCKLSTLSALESCILDTYELSTPSRHMGTPSPIQTSSTAQTGVESHQPLPPPTHQVGSNFEVIAWLPQLLPSHLATGATFPCKVHVPWSDSHTIS